MTIFEVRDLRWGSPTRLENHVLYVDKEEAVAALSDDDRIESWEIDLARPGESVRIIPVKDVIEPRVKLEGGSGFFPGVLGPNETAGDGKTLVLSGAAVVSAGPIMAFQEGFIDMTGPGAEHTPFSKTFNVVVNAHPVEDLEKHQYEEALRLAGLKVGLYLAECCKDADIDKVEVFERGTVAEEALKYPDLPKVAHLCMCITQGLLHDTYLYGVDMKNILPTLVHPNEIIDGAMVSGNCVSACDKNTSWHHVNDPVIKELYALHGKEINFLGMIPTLESTVLAGKEKTSSFNAKLAHELGADRVVAGPGFFAGRYGVACGDVCASVEEKLKIPTVTALYHENPGAEMYASKTYIVRASDSARGMKDAVKTMSSLLLKRLKGDAMGSAMEEGYLSRGVRKVFFHEKTGAKRAVEMLLKKMDGQPFQTEYEMPVFKKIPPSAPIEDLSKATIAIITSGGIVPKGNPDKIRVSSAESYGIYDISSLNDLTPDNYESIHGGYDTTWANENPDVVLPLDVMREFEKEGVIGKLHEYAYCTTGTGTAVGHAERFGQEIGAKLKESGVDGVILTST